MFYYLRPPKHFKYSKSTELIFSTHQALAIYESEKHNNPPCLWLEPQPTAASGGKRCYSGSLSRTDQIAIIEQNLSDNKDSYLYEMFHDNVRLFADIDMDADEAKQNDITPDQLLFAVLKTVEVTAGEKGFVISREGWRIGVSDGSETGKISLHISHLEEVFSYIEDQKTVLEGCSY